jgi:hypothetical protein
MKLIDFYFRKSNYYLLCGNKDFINDLKKVNINVDKNHLMVIPFDSKEGKNILKIVLRLKNEAI